MGFKIKSLLVILLTFCFQFAAAQVRDKREEPSDPAAMYRDIEKYSKKRKFTTFLHKLIFEPVVAKKKPRRKPKSIVKKTYSPFDCKIIRNINITTLDPFGYSEIDTTKKPNSFAFKAGNALHNKTHNLAIKNLLLIRKHTYLDTLLLRESERLIRSQRYIRAVAIRPEMVGKDSVDINIRVLDSWSLVPDFATSGTMSTFKLTEKNFLGTGHEFANTYRKSLNSSKDAFSSSYTIPNIMNTYIRTTLSYQLDVDRNYSKVLNIERPFYSPYARWAGGLYFDQQFRKEIKVDSLDIEHEEHFKYNSQDYWIGRSIQIFKGNTEYNRGTNLILSGRFVNKDYIERPSFAYDSLRVFSSEKMYLAGIAIASRKYTQEKNVLNFNVVEDIASGIVYGLTAGVQHKNGLNRFYYGARFAYGRYFEFGYLSTNAEYGAFLNHGNREQSAIALSALYFTTLLGEGRWKVRQFVKPELILGNRRLPTTADELTLDSQHGIQGFNSTGVYGTKKLLVTLQTQGYSPWNVYGFRLNPFFSYTMGMLGNGKNGFQNSRLYSQVGLGVIVSNDYLVFSSFQISMSYYPTIPGDGNSVLKTNSYKTDDIGLPSFEVNRPQTVPYQ